MSSQVRGVGTDWQAARLARTTSVRPLHPIIYPSQPAGGQVEAITAWQQEFVSMHFRMLEEKRQLVQTREWSVYSGSMVKSTVVVGQQ